MDLFTHLYAVVGIAIRLPEIEDEGRLALFKNAITILKRMEAYAGQGSEPAGAVMEKIALMRSSFVEWRNEGFGVMASEQRTIIRTGVELAGERDLSEL